MGEEDRGLRPAAPEWLRMVWKFLLKPRGLKCYVQFWAERPVIEEGWMKTIRLALVLSLVGLATMACVRFEIGFVVNEDGSGVISYQVAVKDEVVAMADLAGEGDDFSLMDEFGDLPSGAEVQDYEEDGFTGVIISVPVDDFSNWEEVSGAFGALGDSAEDDSQPFDVPTISKDEDGAWHFSMLIPSSEDPGGLMGLTGLDGSEGGMDEFAAMFLEDAWFRVRVELPGGLAEHNADRIEDGALVWELDILSTESRQLTASTVPGGGIPIVPIVAGVVGAAVLVVIVSLAYVRRRR